MNVLKPRGESLKSKRWEKVNGMALLQDGRSGIFAHSEASTAFALCFLPPPHISAILDQLREKHDKAYSSWPPHIRLSYLQPCAANNCELMANLSGRLEPFNITLRAPSRLPGGEKKKDGRKFIASRAAVTFPEAKKPPASPIDLLGIAGLSESFLHCTVAQQANAADADAFTAALDWDEEQMTWRVEALTVLEKRNGRFVPVRDFCLVGCGSAD